MSYNFKLPIIDDLTADQQLAIDETAPLALSGGPGTGKSVVCLWRHIRNYETGTKKSLLLTYTKSLEHYLKVAVDSVNESGHDASINIDRTYWWLTHNRTSYDEIIVDEAHDVSIEKIKDLIIYSDRVSYAADENQSL